MKKLIALLIIGLVSTVNYCQTNINYSSFDAWMQNSSTKKMELIKTIYESGYIEIDNKKATAIIYNSKLNQKELFEFTPFQKVDNGNFIGFGKVNSQQMLTFIPEDNLLLLKVNDVVVMQFSLSQSDILKLKKEFISNFINGNKGRTFLSTNKVDLLEDDISFLCEYKAETLVSKENLNYASRWHASQSTLNGVILDYAKDYSNITVTILSASDEFQENIGLNIGDHMKIYIDNTQKVIDNKMDNQCETKLEKFIIQGRKIKFSIVEAISGGSAYHGIWHLTYAKAI